MKGIVEEVKGQPAGKATRRSIHRPTIYTKEDSPSPAPNSLSICSRCCMRSKDVLTKECCSVMLCRGHCLRAVKCQRDRAPLTMTTTPMTQRAEEMRHRPWVSALMSVHLVEHSSQQGTKNDHTAPASHRHTTSRTSLCR
jgi:hypothetical protein